MSDLDKEAVRNACLEAIRYIGFTLYRANECDEKHLMVWQWEGIAARMKVALQALESSRRNVAPLTAAELDARDIAEVELRA
jgi:hypothetical protein